MKTTIEQRLKMRHEIQNMRRTQDPNHRLLDIADILLDDLEEAENTHKSTLSQPASASQNTPKTESLLTVIGPLTVITPLDTRPPDNKCPPTAANTPKNEQNTPSDAWPPYLPGPEAARDTDEV